MGNIKRISKNASFEEQLQHAWDVIHDLAGDTKVRRGRRNVWQMTNDQAKEILVARKWGVPGVSMKDANFAGNALMGLQILDRELV